MTDRKAFFMDMPQLLPIYQDLEERLLSRFPDITVDVLKTQIAFSNRHRFAFIWLPPRRIAGRPEAYLVLTFGLPCRIDSPRIEEAVEPHPGRWTHHTIIDTTDRIDEQLMGWLEQAYRFSMEKRKAP